MLRTRVVIAAVALAAAFALMMQTDASSGGPWTLRVRGSATAARFGLDAPTDGPFPSDWFTVPDHTNITHRRVSLPLPDCNTYVSDCHDVAVLNELDGFNVKPRLSVPFKGPIDPTTVNSTTLFLVSLGGTGPGQDDIPRGTVIGIDQVVWDPHTETVHVESDELLSQHARFALIVTRGIRDPNGAAIEASADFRQFLADGREDYRHDLIDALHVARQVGLSERDIVAASVFTTQSATAILEKMRDQIHHAPPPAPAEFMLGTQGERTVFDFGRVKNVAWNEQRTTSTDPSTFVRESLALSLSPADAVGTVAFGKYESPNYLVYRYHYIPPVGTQSGVPQVQGPPADIYFNLFLPAGPKPANGWPVAIAGHGVRGNKNADTSFVGSMASYGIATIRINMPGHGYGPESTLTVTREDESSVTLPAGGRGFDQDGDQVVGPTDGDTVYGDRAIVYSSDAFRQTAADLMQLVRVIRVGMDVDGDGQPDLDPSRVYYVGGSWGAALGAVFVAVEPSVRVAVLASPADTIPVGPLGTFRPLVGALMQSRQPSLLNSPGITNLGGLTVGAPFFDDNVPLRSGLPLAVVLTSSAQPTAIQSPVTNIIDGAMAIQEWGERLEWVGEAGSPAAYAPHLRKSPLPGVSAKSVLLMISKGDQSAPNPTTTAILRAGDLADRALWYRHDLYYAACAGRSPSLRNPHTALAADNGFFRPVGLAAQDMAGRFFASDGRLLTVTQPQLPACGSAVPPLFEFPIPVPLPKDLEDLNYIK